METKKKSTFEILSAIDCSKFTEKKNGLTYLSWAHAWREVKMLFADANYEVVNYDGKPYLFDENLGYLVKTIVTIDKESIPMHLFVMDGANKAQKHVDYTYTTRSGEKEVKAATMFDINTTIMRCLTKNLAMFGLGHYIYAGEDLPKQIVDNRAEQLKHIKKAIEEVRETKTIKELEAIWNLWDGLKEEPDFVDEVKFQKNLLTKK